MIIIFKKLFNERKASLVVYAISAILLMLMFISLYPSILENSEQLNQLFESYPEGLKSAFGLEDINFDTLEKFLSMEYFSFMWPILMIVIAISIAASLAREKETGTMSILLSRPMSRLKVYLGHYAGASVILAGFSAITIFAAVPLAYLYNIDIVFKNYVLMFIISFLFGLAILSVSMLLSAIFSEKSKVLVFAGGMMVGMYAINIIARLKESLDFIKYFSFFHYFNSSTVLAKAQLGIEPVAVFLVVSLVCITLGAYIFNRKDI